MTDLRLWKNQSRSTSTSFTCIDRISTNAEDTESADAPVDANMTWREPQQTSSSGLEMGEEWQTRLQSRVRWPRTHPDELWSGAEHFEAALMTSCGTLPGLLSARRDRERETPETGCDGQTEYFVFLARRAARLERCRTYGLEVACIVNFFGHKTVHVCWQLILEGEKNNDQIHERWRRQGGLYTNSEQCV